MILLTNQKINFKFTQKYFLKKFNELLLLSALLGGFVYERVLDTIFKAGSMILK
jgi:hypothetical protein